MNIPIVNLNVDIASTISVFIHGSNVAKDAHCADSNLKKRTKNEKNTKRNKKK
jgi:hypothetical protein